MVCLKLGGSVITEKDSFMKANKRVMLRLADEIARSRLHRILIVHGAGSYGHPLAKKHGIVEGVKNRQQLLGFCEVRMAMIDLNRLVVSALVRKGIPAVPLFPCSYATTYRGRIEGVDLTPIRGLMRVGLVPVTCGDAVSDRELGFTVLSGDQLISYLSINLHAKRIVVGVDVDGIFTFDPKINPDAELIDTISPRELRNLASSLGKSSSTDVTGGMFGKISELIDAVENGIEVSIVNASEPDRLLEALKGDSFVGTRISAGE